MRPTWTVDDRVAASMSPQHAAAMDAIRAFILSRNPELVEIDPDADLIENRIVDSLDFVELLLIIEEITCREIDLEQVDVDHFRTLRAIDDAFL